MVPPSLPPSQPIRNVFSVDVEEHFQVLNFQKRMDRREWETMESRVVASTERVLELLESAGVRGTFFVLGCVAERHPDLVRRIAAARHEVGSHGWSHTPLNRLSPDEAFQELERSRNLLEELAGEPVIGFRAPSFSVRRDTLWALDALLDAGYAYDSSVFPVRHPDYGIPDARPEIHALATPSGRSIVEFPMTVARWMGRTVPVSGGGYFRLLPYGVTAWGLRQVNRSGRPAMFYVHPWEYDPEQPDLRQRTSKLGAFRHYTGLRRTGDRTGRLLTEFAFAPARDVLTNLGFLAGSALAAR